MTEVYIQRTSLVAQQIGIYLAMQGTWVWSPVQEDPKRCRASKPVWHNYWAALQTREPQLLSPSAQLLSPGAANTEPRCCNYWAQVLQLLSPGAATTEPKYCNYWAQVLQLLSPGAATTEPKYCNYWAQVLQLLSPSATTTEPRCCNYWSPSALEPTLCNKRSRCNEQQAHHNQCSPTHCN